MIYLLLSSIASIRGNPGGVYNNGVALFAY